MDIKPLQRDYNFSDSEMSLFASNLLTFLNRDSAEFAARGVDALAISAYETKMSEFEAFPTDAELKGLVIDATQVKDADRAQLEIDIRGVSDRALIKWGEESGKYKRFDVEDLTHLRDKDLLFAARRVVRIGTEYLADLTAEGLTQQMLTDLTTLEQSFEDHLNDVRDAIAERDIKTEERIELGNELYALVSKYCEIGKVIWKNTSEAKYNDYVMYPTSYPTPNQIVGLAYNQTTGELSWTADPVAEGYEAAFTPEQVGEEIWINFWNGTATSTVYDPGGPENYKFKVRGFHGPNKGPWSEVLLVVRV